MSQERPVPLTPAMEKAVNELKGTIAERFPQASFVVEEGFDPKGIYLVTTVDIADTDKVIDVIGDRLVELQVEEGLPIYVTPLRPIQRVVAELREREHTTRIGFEGHAGLDDRSDLAQALSDFFRADAAALDGKKSPRPVERAGIGSEASFG